MGARFPSTTFRVHRLAEMLLDLALLSGAWVMAFLPFVSGPGTDVQRDTFEAAFPILLGTTILSFVLVGVYDYSWRYATARDYASLALVTVLATLLAFGVVVATRDLTDLSPGVLALHALIAVGLITGWRITMRLLPAALARAKKH
jgi:FlaA1/EpsC-like NDP-sugar epimerase